MKEKKKNQALESLLAELRAKPYLKEEEGVFTETIYASYDDRLSDKQVEKILLADDPELTFQETVIESYDQYVWEYKEEIIDRAVRYSYPADAEEEREIAEYLREQIHEVLQFDYPFEHYLVQEHNADLMVDTGDANYSYSCNSVYPYYYGEKGGGINNCASLVWLARSQGYTKRQLEAALDKGDIANPHGFLESVRQEVANETSRMNCLTFLVRMTLEDMISLYGFIVLQEPDGRHFYDARFRPDGGTVTLDKSAMVGLYDPWNGAGSCFEIELDKDIELPIRYIRSCLPDRHFTWSVSSVYGMCESAWKENVVKIEPPAIRVPA